MAEPNVDAAEKATPSDPSQDPQTVRPIHGTRWFLAMTALYSTAFLYGLDTTITADLQPAIVHSLGDIEKLTWIGSGFPLDSIAIILPVGFAYGLFNIKYLYLLFIVIFEVGSALCGAVPTMGVLIVGRIIAGAGGAGIYLGVLNYISLLTTLREGSVYNAITSLVWGLGTVLRPVVGGGFASSGATCRWAFYINLCLAAVFAPGLVFLLPQHKPDSQSSFKEKMKRIDWVGSVLIAAVITTYVVALTLGGGQWAWSDGRFIATIVVCGVLLVTFIITQYYALFTTKERRIFPGQFIRHRSLLLIYISTASSITSLFVGTYYIPLFFQFARDDTAIKAGVRLLPFIIISVVTIMLNGALMPVFGYYMPWYFAGGVFMTIGGALMYTVDSETSTSKIYGYSVLLAIDAGSALQSGYSIAASKVAVRDIPAAIGFINISQLGSVVIALTISGSVFQNLADRNLQQALAGQGFSASEIRGAIAGTQSVVLQNSSPEVRAAAISAIIQAMDKVYVLVIAAGALTLVSPCS